MALDNLAAIMDAIAAATMTPPALASRAYPYPPASLTPPCVVVGYPTTLDFDLAYQRGADQATIPVYFVVGKPSEAYARDALSAVIADATSIKSRLDGDLGGIIDSLRVADLRVVDLQVADISYLAAVFDTEVVA